MSSTYFHLTVPVLYAVYEGLKTSVVVVATADTAPVVETVQNISHFNYCTFM